MKISFCIISDGQEPEKLSAQVDSIHALNVPEYEVIIAGNPNIGVDVDLIIPMPNTARQGRLGAMRNAVVSCAGGEIVIVTDDDMVFDQQFHDALMNHEGEWDVMACRILNPDGTRYWDWKAHKDGKNWLLEYGDTSEYQSLTGGVTIAKAHVFETVEWNSELTFNQAEDVDFTNRLKAAGFGIVFNEKCIILHNAPYTQVGIGVFKKE